MLLVAEAVALEPEAELFGADWHVLPDRKRRHLHTACWVDVQMLLWTDSPEQNL